MNRLSKIKIFLGLVYLAVVTSVVIAFFYFGANTFLSPSYLIENKRYIFELRDQNGKVDVEATFELAKIWSDAGTFDKLTLDYDTYDPSGELNAQIIIEVPDIKSYNDINFKRNVQTLFNNNVQSNDALVEIEL